MLVLTPIKIYLLLLSGWYSVRLFSCVLSKKCSSKYEAESENKLPGWLIYNKRQARYALLGILVNVIFLWTLWRSYCGAQSPTMFVDYLLQLTSSQSISIPNAPEPIFLCLVLHLVHLGSRVYESVFASVHCLREHLNLLQVVLSYAHEVIVVLSLIAEAPDFYRYHDCFSLNKIKWTVLPALAIFCFAVHIRRNSMHHLKSLRKNKAGHIVTTAYKQPKASYFESLNVSNPHHFAELLLHLSLLCILGFGCQTWLLLCFQLSLQLLTISISSHRFYCSKFEDYPTTRKIMIPYLL